MSSDASCTGGEEEFENISFGGNLEDRFEIPPIRDVHFLLHGHLDRGWSVASTFDGLGKTVCEYLRAKYVDIPTVFLETGKASHQRRPFS